MMLKTYATKKEVLKILSAIQNFKILWVADTEKGRLKPLDFIPKNDNIALFCDYIENGENAFIENILNLSYCDIESYGFHSSITWYKPTNNIDFITGIKEWNAQKLLFLTQKN